MLHHRRKTGVYITTPQEHTGPRYSTSDGNPLSPPCRDYDATMPKHGPPSPFQCVQDGCIPSRGRNLSHAYTTTPIPTPTIMSLRKSQRAAWTAIVRHRPPHCIRTKYRDSLLPRRGLLPPWWRHTSGKRAHGHFAGVEIRFSLGKWYPSSCSRYGCSLLLGSSHNPKTQTPTSRIDHTK